MNEINREDIYIFPLFSNYMVYTKYNNNSILRSDIKSLDYISI